jgi:predicted ABC-type ATPase
MRVFAGPNGSGKSTIINKVKGIKIQGRNVDFGIYVNADDIAEDLRKNKFIFSTYQVNVLPKQLKKTALESGLINDGFTEQEFSNCYSLRKNKVKLLQPAAVERLAQILADFLRKKLLKEKKKFSFETVFSHQSKLDIMQEAVQAGYKVYLYFVSTESPEINKYRVERRVKNGGHPVDPVKITQRYYRSLDLLFDAAQLSYQAYFIDNSEDGEKSAKLFAHFKVIMSKKKWDDLNVNDVPEWFKKYYSDKVKNHK